MSALSASRDATHFAIFRSLLGGFLVLFFARQIPYASELYGRDGMVPEPGVNYTAPIWPDPLDAFDAPWELKLVLALAALASLPLLVGWHRRPVALAVWMLFVALFWRNNFIRHVAIDYIGWMLLVCVAAPGGEGRLAWSRRDGGGRDWRLPREIRLGAWAVASLSYSLSGWAKLESPLWRDGSALSYILTHPMSRDWLPTRLLTDFPALLSLATWGSLAAELLCLPLALWSRTRALIWLVLTAMHLGIALLISLGEITVALLIFHVLLFDPRWLGPADRSPRVAPGEGP